MTSIDHGMSVSDVEALGHKLQDSYAAEIRQAIAQLEQLVKSTTSSWVGKDGDEFRSWWPSKRSKLAAIADDLHGYGQSALNNAHEQTVASDGGASAPVAAGLTAAGAVIGGASVASGGGVGSTPSAQTGTPGSASAAVDGPQLVENARIADVAETEARNSPHKYQGQNGWDAQGECMVATARWLKDAGGHWVGGRDSPIQSFTDANAARVGLGDVVRGDILQKYTPSDPSSWTGVHTVVVLSNNGNGTLRIAESNFDLDGNMRIVEDWKPEAQGKLEWSAWRFGQV